ncbi:hypothetical protein [Streptosporangium sp. NPDC049644]|uniref:hypothetical protein n=1 Tax=Streptosporangium sp. NPDC049644 TaxID=3155507 RepID=UPI00341B16D5
MVSAIAEMMAPRRAMEPELISEVAIDQMLWDAIQEDQIRARRNVIPHGERHIARASDEIVQALGTSDFAASLRASVIDGNLSRSVYATYLYYREGDWVPLHVDDWNIFEFSCLVCLERTRGSSRPTATYFLLGRENVMALDLNVGEAVWFHGVHIPHGRTPLSKGESVVLLNLGFSSSGTTDRLYEEKNHHQAT